MRKLQYEEMLPHELEAARLAAPLVYLPIGSLEYHGRHLPTGFDGLHARAYCLRAAEQTGGVVLPPTYWGFRGHEGFPGSLLLPEATVAALVGDALEQVAAQGYRLLVVFTGHWPEVQGKRLQEVGEAHVARHPETRVMVLDPFNLHPTDPHAEHAGCLETSAMLYLRPDLVEMDRLREPGALDAITPDCMDATEPAGHERFVVVLGELVRVVREALRELPPA